MSDLHGILAIDKPVGFSSMKAVAIVRRRAGGVRTGHAGTLDPLATGVLVLALGKCTKQIAGLMATEKRYLTTIDLSAFTDTDDLEGVRTEVPLGSAGAATTAPTRAHIEAVLASPSYARTLSRNATTLASGYTWSITAARLRRLYGDLASREPVKCAARR